MLRNFVQIIRSGVVGRKSLGTTPKRLVRGWFEALPPSSLELVRAEGVGGREPWWGLMELALSSKARLLRQVGNTLPRPYRFRPAGDLEERSRVG